MDIQIGEASLIRSHLLVRDLGLQELVGLVPGHPANKSCPKVLHSPPGFWLLVVVWLTGCPGKHGDGVGCGRGVWAL